MEHLTRDDEEGDDLDRGKALERWHSASVRTPAPVGAAQAAPVERQEVDGGGMERPLGCAPGGGGSAEPKALPDRAPAARSSGAQARQRKSTPTEADAKQGKGKDCGEGGNANAQEDPFEAAEAVERFSQNEHDPSAEQVEEQQAHSRGVPFVPAERFSQNEHDPSAEHVEEQQANSRGVPFEPAQRFSQNEHDPSAEQVEEQQAAAQALAGDIGMHTMPDGVLATDLLGANAAADWLINGKLKRLSGFVDDVDTDAETGEIIFGILYEDGDTVDYSYDELRPLLDLHAVEGSTTPGKAKKISRGKPGGRSTGRGCNRMHGKEGGGSDAEPQASLDAKDPSWEDGKACKKQESSSSAPDTKQGKDGAKSKALRGKARPGQALGDPAEALSAWIGVMGSLDTAGRGGAVEDMQQVLEQGIESARVLMLSVRPVEGAQAPVAEAAKHLHRLISLALRDPGHCDTLNGRLSAVGCVCSGMCAAQLQASKAHGSSSEALLGDAAKLLGCVIRSLTACEEGKPAPSKRARGKGAARDGDGVQECVGDCLEAAQRLVLSHHLSDDVVLSITRCALEGLACTAFADVVAGGIRVLQAIFGRYEQHRHNVLDEVFHMGIADDRLTAKASGRAARTATLEGAPGPMLVASAALVVMVQGMAGAEGTPDRDTLVKQARASALYFVSLFEGRFSSKSLQKGSVKDPEAKAFLAAFVEDVLSLLDLPCFPVAELVVSQVVDRLEALALDAKALGLAEFYRSAATEVLCTILTRLARHRAEAGAALQLSAPDGASEGELSTGLGGRDGAGLDERVVEKQLEEQQDAYSDEYAGGSGRGTFQSPISRAKNANARERLFDAQLQQSLLNFLCSQRGTAAESISGSAHLLHTALWAVDPPVESSDESENGDFWWSQGCAYFHGRALGTTAPSPVLPVQNINAGCFRLALKRPLLAKLSARFSAFVPILRGSRPVDRVRLLKAINEAIAIDATVIRSSIISLIQAEYILDPENANVRAAAVEVIASALLSKLRMLPTANISEQVTMLSDRCFDTSLAVRLSVLHFLRELCKLERTSISAMIESKEGGVGCGDVQLRLVDACTKVALMLTKQRDESIVKSCTTFFLDLWFAPEEPPSGAQSFQTVPPEVCVDEMLKTLQACGADSTEWLEDAAGEAGAEAKARLVGVLCGRIAGIQNQPLEEEGGGAFSTSPSKRPSEYNDFTSRSVLLLPMLRVLAVFSRTDPLLFTDKLSCLRPLLLEKEVSKEHLDVLRLLLEILQTVLPRLDAPPSDLESDLCAAFHTGAFKLTDPKRFVSMDDVCRAVRCFATVVKCYKNSYGYTLLSKMLEQNLNFLKGYIQQPAESKVAWLPRSLIVSGAIVRYLDARGLDEAQGATALARQECLFSICMSHFANHTNENVRRCAVHALGSIMTRDPKKILQTPCTKLLARSLHPTSPASLQSQVLRNLMDHFESEDSLTAEDSASGLQASVSDASTTLIHHFHQQILDASLSTNAVVRGDAVALIRVVMRKGLTASYLCLPYLFAQQCSPAQAASRIAMGILAEVHEKQVSMYSPHALWDGVVKSHALVDSAERLPRDAFGAAFRLLAGTGKDGESRAVRQLLMAANAKFEKFSAECCAAEGGEGEAGGLGGGLKDLVVYVAAVCASLPFVTLDGVLFQMHSINTLVTSVGGRCLEGLKAAAVEGGRAGGAESAIGLDVLRREGNCMGILLSLSTHLQRVYCVRADKMRRFTADPKAIDKTATRELDFSAVEAFDVAQLFGDAAPAALRADIQALGRLVQASMCTEGAKGGGAEAREGGVDWDAAIDDDGAKSGGKTGKKRALYGGKGKKDAGRHDVAGGDDDEFVAPQAKAKSKRADCVSPEFRPDRPSRRTKTNARALDDDDDSSDEEEQLSAKKTRKKVLSGGAHSEGGRGGGGGGKKRTGGRGGGGGGGGGGQGGGRAGSGRRRRAGSKEAGGRRRKARTMARGSRRRRRRASRAAAGRRRGARRAAPCRGPRRPAPGDQRPHLSSGRAPFGHGLDPGARPRSASTARLSISRRCHTATARFRRAWRRAGASAARDRSLRRAKRLDFSQGPVPDSTGTSVLLGGARGDFIRVLL